MCVSPEAYDEAMGRVRELEGRDIEPLKKELAEKKQCMFVDPEMADGIMAPFALVLQARRQQGASAVRRYVRKRIELLHRLTNRYVLVGWTEEANLEAKRVL